MEAPYSKQIRGLCPLAVQDSGTGPGGVSVNQTEGLRRDLTGQLVTGYLAAGCDGGLAEVVLERVPGVCV